MLSAFITVAPPSRVELLRDVGAVMAQIAIRQDAVSQGVNGESF